MNAAWIVNSPAVLVAVFKIVTDVSRLSTDEHKSTSCTLEQDGKIKTFVLHVEIQTTGKCWVPVFVKAHFILVRNSFITIDVFKLHIARAKRSTSYIAVINGVCINVFL